MLSFVVCSRNPLSFMQGLVPILIWSFLKMELLLIHLLKRQSTILYYHWY